MHPSEYNRLHAIESAAQACREMTPEEKRQADATHTLFSAVRVNYDAVMMHGTDEDRLELQRALKPIALRIVQRQPG